LSLKGKVNVVIIEFDLRFIALSKKEHYPMVWSIAILKKIVQAKWRVTFKRFLYHSAWRKPSVLHQFLEVCVG